MRYRLDIFKTGITMLAMVTVRTLPFRLSLLVLLACMTPAGSRAADNWVEVRSPHFTVSSNAGDKEARKIADQFEQIRQMFHTAFATLRVDPPQPIAIIAAKNEGTMKLYLPEEWEVKGHIHHAGLYQAAQDKDYVVLRLDTEGANPFHTLYHEYTHALVRLNFHRLPLWLDEGLAEFYGNSTIGEKEIKTGTIDSGHLYILGNNKLIPIQTLLEVDHGSPYYNESNRASVFYAESWALVHYLMMDPDARKAELLKNFLTAYGKSNDQVTAATEAFGDLKRFGQKIESYARQTSFRIGILKTEQQSAEKTYPSRPLSGGELLALRGDFFVHHSRTEQARAVLEEALKDEPKLPFVHEAMGMYYWRSQQTKEADDEMVEAIKLGATDFGPPYFHGMLLLQGGGSRAESGEEARKSLEKAIQINPQFAPAYEALSHAYPRTPEGQKLAIGAALKAVQLDPGTLHYSVNLAYLLINNDQDAEAKLMLKRIQDSAESPMDRQIASSLEQTLQQHEEWAARRKAAGDNNATVGVVTSAGAAAPASIDNAGTPREFTTRRQGQTYAIEGLVSDADCSKTPEITINLTMTNGPITFHAVDFGKVSLSSGGGVATPTLANCGQWKGHQAKVWFSATPGKDYAGEISKLYFH
jgi:Flp pilus assembly protein TadD